MICLTGDLHHASLGTANQRHCDTSEIQVARRYLDMLSEAGVKVLGKKTRRSTIAYAVEKIDQWSALKAKFGPEKSRDFVSTALAIVDSFSEQRRDDPVVFDKLAKKFAGFPTEHLQFLIAENLQSQLPELIYVTQIIHDQKFRAVSKEEMRKRLEEAKDLTLAKYNRLIGVPSWRKQIGHPQADSDTFIQRGSLAAIIDRLRDNPRVHILHNADDLLVERKSVEGLEASIGTCPASVSLPRRQ